MDVAPSDWPWIALWRRLAEFRAWAPLAVANAMRETLQSLGYRGAFIDSQAEDWLASRHIREQGPVLIRAGLRSVAGNRAAEPRRRFPGGLPVAGKGFGRVFLSGTGPASPPHPANRPRVDERVSGLRGRGGTDGRRRARSAAGGRGKEPVARPDGAHAPIVTARGLAKSLAASGGARPPGTAD